MLSEALLQSYRKRSATDAEVVESKLEHDLAEFNGTRCTHSLSKHVLHHVLCRKTVPPEHMSPHQVEPSSLLRLADAQPDLPGDPTAK